MIAQLYYPCLDFGGVESHILTLLGGLEAENGCGIVLAPVSSRFRAQAASLTSVQFIEWMPRHPLLDIVALLRLVRILKNIPVTLLHIHSPAVDALGRLAAHLCGIPVLFTVHTPIRAYYTGGDAVRASGFKARLRVALHRGLNRLLPVQVIYVSQAALQEALQKGDVAPARARCIPNCVDLERFQPDERKRRDARIRWGAGDVPVICFTGRLHVQKRVDLLLTALGQLDDHLEWQAWIVGEGGEESHLRRQAQELQLEKKVRFLGYQPDISDLLPGCDVFVLPSDYEGLSISLLEAMAAGLPSVVSDVGENACLVEEDVNGFVVPPGDARCLAQKMQALLTDAGLRCRMGVQARAKAIEYRDRHSVRDIYRVFGLLLLP
jgi:L-malate glycosyltransferase